MRKDLVEEVWGITPVLVLPGGGGGVLRYTPVLVLTEVPLLSPMAKD